MKHFSNLLIIAGNGRNVGKTTLACKIINRYSKDIDIISLKISPHIHNDTGSDSKFLINSCNFALIEEFSVDSNKDSSRMLKAGATKSFYLQVNDIFLEKVLPYTKRFIDFNSIIVCESGWLRQVYKPGLFLIVNHPEKIKKIKKKVELLQPLADMMILYDGHNFDPGKDCIVYTKDGWGLKNS